jgi:LysM repeat protein
VAGRPRPSAGSPLFALALAFVVGLPVFIAVLVLTQTGILEDDNSADPTATGVPALFETAAEPALDLSAAAALVDTATPASPPAEEEAAPEPQVYLVQAGDTLSVIARTYGTTVAALVAYNQLPDRDALRIGQELRIPPPGYEPPSAVPVTPATAPAPPSPAPGVGSAEGG